MSILKFYSFNARIFVFTFFIMLIISCNSVDTTRQPLFNSDIQIEDTIVQANKFLLERDKEQIESYIKRRAWKMNYDESGLWYQIYEKTKGTKTKTGDIVQYFYQSELLDGTVCYKTGSKIPAQIKIGQSGKETGLEKGLLMMRTGEKAHFILPPHLAHGLIGDMDRIPSRSTIVYEVELINIIDF